LERDGANSAPVVVDRSCSGQCGRVLRAGAARDPGRSADRDSRV